MHHSEELRHIVLWWCPLQSRECWYPGLRSITLGITDYSHHVSPELNIINSFNKINFLSNKMKWSVRNGQRIIISLEIENMDLEHNSKITIKH